MTLERLLSRTVEIQTPGTTVDRYGDTILDWSAPATRTVKAWVAQTGTNEDRAHRDSTSVTLDATFEVSAALTAKERVVIDGRVYEVDGEPNVAHTPRGPHHIEATLVSVRG